MKISRPKASKKIVTTTNAALTNSKGFYKIDGKESKDNSNYGIFYFFGQIFRAKITRIKQ